MDHAKKSAAPSQSLAASQGGSAANKGGEAPKYRTTALSHRKPTRFHWQPDAAGRTALARALELPSIESLSIKGEITPDSRADFRLIATLKAALTQSCVVSLAPVPATIDEPVLRRYLQEWTDPDSEEYEVSEDDADEPLPEVIDIFEVAREALSLALPPYPRAPGATLGETLSAPPGVTPIADEELRPFAGLASLLQKGTTADSGADAEVAPVSEKARNASPDSTE